jgi:hypothetical protein
MSHTQSNPKNTVILQAGGTNMLEITPDGFYVRGVKVPVDDKEAETVYNSFQQWLTWAQLQKQNG